MRKGRYIHIDGIDGSGKSTMINAAHDWFTKRGLRVFDTVEWSRANGRPPTFEEVKGADVLFTSEPTHYWIGAAIRDEIIRNGTPYGAKFTAEAFALDRALQITRFVRPFLETEGRWVIQDRSVISSMAYQPLQSERDGDADPVTIPWLTSLRGNRTALDFAPDAFVLVDLDAAIAQERIHGRTDKQDDACFEHLDFQTALSKRYRDPAVTDPLRARGTEIIIVDGSLDKESMANKMIEVLEKRA